VEPTFGSGNSCSSFVLKVAEVDEIVETFIGMLKVTLTNLFKTIISLFSGSVSSTIGVAVNQY
jgi:hypothetical protein